MRNDCQAVIQTFFMLDYAPIQFQVKIEEGMGIARNKHKGSIIFTANAKFSEKHTFLTP